MTVVTNIVNNRALVTGSLLLLGGLSIYYFSSKAKSNTKEGTKDRQIRTTEDENQSQKVHEPIIKPAIENEHTEYEHTEYEPTTATPIPTAKKEPVSRSIEIQPTVAVTSGKNESVITAEITQKESAVADIVAEKETFVETIEHVADTEKESVAILTESTKDNTLAIIEQVKEETVECVDKEQVKEETVECVDKEQVKEETVECVDKEQVKEETVECVDKEQVKEETVECVDKEQVKETVECVENKTSEAAVVSNEEVMSLIVTDVPTATIDEPADTPYAASSADENDIGTPENEPASMPTFRSYDDIPEFIPQQKPRKRSTKKSLTRIQLIEQQRQSHTPTVSARCNHWPRCTNKHCKYWHPFKMCRAGDECYYGKKCMFVHPSDYLEQQEKKDPSDNVQQYF
ncbi:unnamed protein product [Rhizopus stolonifer]